MSRTRRFPGKHAALLALSGAVALGAGAGSTPVARTAAARATLSGAAGKPASPTYIQWLRVDASQPRTLFLGGTAGCSPDTEQSVDSHVSCPRWVMRSSDGGATWTDLSDAVGRAIWIGPAQAVGTTVAESDVTIDSPLLAASGRRLYLTYTTDGVSPHDSGQGELMSLDGGSTWEYTGITAGDGSTSYNLALSPLSDNRLYIVDYDSDGNATDVAYSDDAGRGWHQGAHNPGGDSTDVPVGLVADPAHRDTVYANMSTDSGTPAPPVRSDDAGKTWSTVAPPAGLDTFMVSTDPHEGTALVGQTSDAGMPADRIYLSHDGGRTWTISTCPGYFHGVCPSFTVDNVFGAGASYAFVHDRVYRFSGAGPAVAPIDVQLPVATAALMDVEAGNHAGDPVYLLAKGTNGNVHGVVYRSLDGGKSWQRMAAGVLPNLAPPSGAATALYVAPTRHSVAAPFVALYRKLGFLVVGYPLTEAYLEGTTLRQDFEHLRLELRGGKVVVAPLGSAMLQFETPYGGFSGDQDASPVPNTPSQRYFPQTKRILAGDFLQYWQAHGGLAVFGAPLTSMVRNVNGDGSGHTYQMQWFQNARLERHPEIGGSYLVLEGLVGKESLIARGWLPGDLGAQEQAQQ